MENEAELIRKNIETTREDLADSLGALENKVRGVVSNVKSVGKNLNPVHQAETHPLIAVGVSLAAGALVGSLLTRERTEIGAEGILHKGESIYTKVRNSKSIRQFDDEIKMLKNMAIGFGIKRAAEAAINAFPKVASEISAVVESAEDKLGLCHEGHEHSTQKASRL